MLPSLGDVQQATPVKVPFGTPADAARSAGDPPNETYVTFWVLACARERWAALESSATETGADGVEVVKWDSIARDLFVECVKHSESAETDRLEFTADDATELATVWPEHVYQRVLAAVVNLNRTGTIAPKVPPALT